VSAPRDRLASLGAALRRRVHARSRARRHRLFMSVARPGPGDAVLDVGVTDLSGYGANLLEQLYPWPERITAAALEPLGAFPAAFPAVTTVQADGRSLPFPDASFDVVYSTAVLEHVGDAEDQRAFLAELARVGRRVLFVATPSRSFPIDSHTLVLFAHWLPPRARDAVCARLGVGEWVHGRLRLVTARELERLATLAGWPPHVVARQRLFGITSVLVLHAQPGGGRA
jgi:hypothetical protein